MEKWIESDGALTRDFSFEDFAGAVSFVIKVALLAEKNNHHPDSLIHGYRHVLLKLSTHDAGKITEKDYNLAGQVDKL